MNDQTKQNPVSTLTQEQREILYSLQKISRHYLFHLLKTGACFKDVCTRVLEMDQAERKIMHDWNKFLLLKIKFYKSSEVGELCRLLRSEQLTLPQIISKAQKLKKKNDSKELMRFTTILNQHNDKVNTFAEQSFDKLIHDCPVAEIVNDANEITRQELFLWEEYIYMRQTIKNIFNLCELGISPSTERLAVALDKRFINEPDIIDKQANLILQVYETQCSNPTSEAENIKKVCLDFIGECFKQLKVPNAKLLIYLFKEDYISPQIFCLLLEHEKELRNCGMNPLVYSFAEKLAKNISPLSEKQTESDKLVQALLKSFSD